LTWVNDDQRGGAEDAEKCLNQRGHQQNGISVFSETSAPSAPSAL